jgi:superfamily II DNA or RNA helicase
MDVTPAPLPPLLKRFHDCRPGDIHDVAAKVHLIAGFEACKANTLTDAVWNADQTSLAVSFVNGAQTTLLLDGFSLLTKCSCKQWQPARNCPHVVMVWATLKRMVSPTVLLQVRFNRQLLLDMKRYTDREPSCGNSVAADQSPERQTLKRSESQGGRLSDDNLDSLAFHQASAATTPQFRLVIETVREGRGLSGRVMRGSETVSGWTATGIPTDLALFLASTHGYQSTPRYFETFLKQTGGKYPIVYRDAQEHETALSYRGDEPRGAGVTFDIRGDEVIISRCLKNGDQIPADAFAHGRLLFVPEAGALYPITNLEAWRIRDDVIKRMYASHGSYEYGRCGTDEGEDDDGLLHRCDAHPLVLPQGFRRVPHGIALPLPLFNDLRVPFDAEKFDHADAGCSFFLNGAAVAAPLPGTPSYLLDLPSGITQQRVSLRPAGLFDGETFYCSSAVFWLLNAVNRNRLSPLMGAMKRVRAVMDAAFQLIDETEISRAEAIACDIAAAPDFAKYGLQGEVEQLLNHLAREWSRTMHLLLATPNGWHRVEEDRRSQARLMRILCELFGLDAFSCDVNAPRWLGLSRERLLKDLPRLLSRLQAEGFALRVGNEPLEEARWEFSLDATASSLDWFELHPEILCDGEPLTVEEIQGLLAGSRVLSRGGRMILLDQASAEVMALLAGALPTRKRKRETKAEPVRVPRLQILDWLQLRSHGVAVKLAPDDARMLESLLNFEAIAERPLPAGLDATLRHYQVDAYRWLGFLYEHRFGACLADDMGLGKTLQGIALLAGIIQGEIASAAPGGTPHLVVAPPSLLFNWEAEIARFLPAARVLLYTGGGRSTDSFRDYDIVITSYGIVQRDIDQLDELLFNVIIFDETQMVKNLKAATTNAVRRLRGTFSLALTGTPVENHLGEYYAIMDLCLPGLLGSREDFGREINRGGSAIERLIRRTRPFILRRTKQLITAELPPKIEIDIHLELLPKQKALYQQTVEEVRGQVREAFASRAQAQARIIALTAILRLRQICLAPSLAATGASEASPKLDFLIEQLQELKDEGHSALVFSQFTGYLDVIEKGLKHHGLCCLRLDGSTPVPRRKQLVEAFQNATEPTVFLISLKAGGKGLNLTRASYVYHMDPWWNPAVENQASDRAHRIGQTGQVTITRLIMRHTIEEKMMVLKERKSKLYKAILEEGTGRGGAGLTREDFELLLG